MDASTLLLRQVHPQFVQMDVITSQVFAPMGKAELSLYDGDQITPEGAWKHYTEELGRKSVGVVAVTVAECEREDLEPRLDHIGFAEHTTLDFSKVPKGRTEAVAKRLKAAAQKRGWQYGPK